MAAPRAAFKIKRRPTRSVQVGSVHIGGDAPIAIQSMNNTAPHDAAACLRQIHELAAAGCEITRLAVPDLAAVQTLAAVRRQSPLPIVADIHFDWRLALAAIEAGADKIRINPGNIGGPERLAEVARAALARGIPIRVGVNGGSLAPAMIARHGGVTAEALTESALQAIAQLEACRFENIVLSVKASDPLLTLAAHRLIAERTDRPLHIGLTEAGTARQGTVYSAVALGLLLAEGIGDTIRVSLTGDPVAEVRVAWDILQALHLRRRGAILTSCPTCGRTEVDLAQIAADVETRLQDIHQPIHVAVMGCAVNGPGEARMADVGIAGGKGAFVLFRRGQILRKLPQEQAVEALMAEVRRFCAETAAADPIAADRPAEQTGNATGVSDILED